MSRKFTFYCFVAALLAVAIAAGLFAGASSVYWRLRAADATMPLEQITHAADRANLWFILLLLAGSTAIILLGRLIVLRRKNAPPSFAS